MKALSCCLDYCPVSTVALDKVTIRNILGEKRSYEQGGNLSAWLLII